MMTNIVSAAEQALGIDIGVTASGRAYYWDDDTSAGYWATQEDLAYALECAGPDAYSQWCAGIPSRPMSRKACVKYF